ncbi:MAG: hypothetical protein QM764_22115 [Chitinophagaceae bacterium]
MKKFPNTVLCCLTILCFLTGCSHGVVPVTNPQLASIPVITINGFEDGGTVEKNNQTAESTVNADYGMTILISGSAKDPGGVKDFSIRILRGAVTLFSAATSSSPGTDGKVPDLLAITGTNGSGSTGNLAMKFTADDITVVQVSATNYAGKTTSFSLHYIPVAASQRKKDIIQTVVMDKNPTLDIFTATAPQTSANATLVAVNGSGYDVYLLKPSNGTPFTCSDPSASIRLPAYGNLFPNDYMQLFGSLTPNLPLTFRACALGPSANADHIQFLLTYRFN